MADSPDPSVVALLFEKLPVPTAICSPDGTVLVCSDTFRSTTGLDKDQRPDWLTADAACIQDLTLGEKHFRVSLLPLEDHLLVSLVETTETVKMEEALWDHQLRLSKVYSELNVKNKKLSDALEEVSTREKQLQDLNEALEKKVAEQVSELEHTGRLKRYLSPEIANSIISDNALNLGTHKRLITIFFVELSDFDDLTAEMESEEAIEILNEYHREMTSLIFAHGGTIDKFITSRIIGFFGDPIPATDHAQRAVRMALEMREKIRELREHWFLGASNMELRAGILTGYATVGNVGCAERMDYTVIGKNVALASQLQMEARPGQILLSKRTYEAVKNEFDCEHLEISVKSGSKPISVFNLRRSREASSIATLVSEEALPTSQSLSPGQRLGPYQIVEKLGEGGMGVVYKGYDESLERHVAVKVLSPTLSHDEKFLVRFRREARALANLNSPHIAQIYFISDTGTFPFFAMEFVDGMTLSRKLEQSGRIPLRQALEITSQVVEALEAALEKDIIHRDIKPDNIMLTRKEIVKVTDFGLVKSFGGDSFKTTEGIILGTPYYMSPEQARAQEVDHRSDMYSLGATLFHMLVGQPPYRGDSALDILRKHAETQLPALGTLPPDITTRIYNIVQRLMAKDRHDRFPTYQALREELANC